MALRRSFLGDLVAAAAIDLGGSGGGSTGRTISPFLRYPKFEPCLNAHLDREWGRRHGRYVTSSVVEIDEGSSDSPPLWGFFSSPTRPSIGLAFARLLIGAADILWLPRPMKMGISTL